MKNTYGTETDAGALPPKGAKPLTSSARAQPEAADEKVLSEPARIGQGNWSFFVATTKIAPRPGLSSQPAAQEERRARPGLMALRRAGQ